MKKDFILVFCACIFINVHAQRSGKDSVLVSTSNNKAKKPATKTPEKPKPEIKPDPIPIPEFINQPYYFDRNDNRLIRLEGTTAQLVSKKKSLGLKGAKQYLSMDGASSKIRFTAKSGITFIIKTTGDVIDLTSYIKIYKFISEDQKREVLISSKDGIINDNESEKGKQISMSVKMISKDNYMIQFPDNLEAGEYGFVWVKNMELKEFSVHAFGIDWKSSD
jgi:hypothetical protein